MNSNSKVHQITRMAILVAIIFLLAFTPLGYLTIGPIAATTIQMPVIVGAVMMGPAAGAVLGFFFGLSAVIKVLTMPGAPVCLLHGQDDVRAVCPRPPRVAGRPFRRKEGGKFLKIRQFFDKKGDKPPGMWYSQSS